jgi:hypothetical protein
MKIMYEKIKQQGTWEDTDLSALTVSLVSNCDGKLKEIIKHMSEGTAHSQN